MINNFLQKFNLILAQPFWLWLLLLIPLYLLLRKLRKGEHESYWTISNLPKNFVRDIPLKIKLRPVMTVLRIIAMTCIIIALARPQRTDRSNNITGEGIDIMLSIDISGSMLDKDFEPNRLEAAKHIMAQFVQERPNDRIGLVIFAGESFTQCPVTLDHAVLIQQIGILTPELLLPGTSIGNGLASAVNGFRNSTAKSKIIVLMTDGVNQPNEGLNIKPEKAIELANLYNIKVYTIGIGSKGKALRPMQQPDGTVVDVLTDVEIDEALLQKIAAATNGKYFRATDNNTLKNIYKEIDQLEKSKIESTVNYQYKDIFYLILIPGFMSLLLEIILRFTYFRSLTEE